jgi:hypothetical protein
MGIFASMSHEETRKFQETRKAIREYQEYQAALATFHEGYCKQECFCRPAESMRNFFFGGV